MPISTRCIYLLSLCLIGAGLGGCATTTNIQLAQVPVETPIKILVMQSPLAIGPGRLQKVLAPDTEQELSMSDEPIAQGVKHAQEYALVAMESAITKPTRIIAVTWPGEEAEFINRIQELGFGSAISQEEADHIHKTTGADAVLRFTITDYGLTPKSWRKGYITFEVITTLALAAVIAYSGSKVAKAAAGAYLVQEAVEETAEGYVGFWALDVVCRPVRVEAELIQLNPVKTIWRSSDTGLADVSLSRLTRKVESAERDNQLNQATDYAVKDIASTLIDSLKPAAMRQGP